MNIDELKIAAEAGDAEAQYKLGIHFYDLRNVDHPGSDSEARVWFYHAAYQGHAAAQYELAWMYDYGYSSAHYGCIRDEKEAAKWYAKAEAQGFTWKQSRRANR